MEITNGEIKADLPDTLAKLLINNLDAQLTEVGVYDRIE